MGLAKWGQRHQVEGVRLLIGHPTQHSVGQGFLGERGRDHEAVVVAAIVDER